MWILRTDITITASDTSPGCQLHDPRNGEVYEFGAVESFLLQRIAVPYSEEDIAAECSRHFEQSFNESDINGFLELLAGWGLLEESEHDDTSVESEGLAQDKDEPAPEAPGLSQEKDVRQPNRWDLFNPQAALDRMLSLVQPIRAIVWLIPLLFTIGLIAVMSHADMFSKDMSNAMAQFGLIGRLIFAAFTVNLISQIGRGLVARYYGMSTPSLGLMLLFGLIPRFNLQIIPDGGMSRQSRLWLNAISTLIRLGIFGLAAIVWASTRTSGSSLAMISIELAILSVISLLFVANPLWRGDGANFISAWLEIPNIQQRSRKAMFGLFVKEPSVIIRHSKHRLALGLFGLASLLFFSIFVGFIVLKIFSSLEQQYHGAGVALFLALALYVSLMIRRQIKANQSRQSKLQGKHVSTEMHDDGRGHGGEGETSGSKRLVRFVVIMSLLGLAFFPYRYETGGTAEIVPSSRVTIAAEMDGLLEQVFFNGGEWVEKGTKLARQSYHRQQKDMRVTESSIEVKHYEIERYLTTPSAEEIKLAEERLESARLQLKYSKEELERIKPLYKEGVLSQQSYEDARKVADLHRQEYEEAKVSLDAVKTQINPNQIASLRADKQRLEQELEYYSEQLEKTYLRSPIEGRIITKDLKFMQNSYLEAGQTFAEIEDIRLVIVRVAVPEADIGEITPGAAVKLKLWAYPNRTFEGVVDEIQPSTEEASYGRVVYVSSKMDNPNDDLKSGLTGYAKIMGSETVALVAFTRAFVRFVTIEAWSWLP